MEEDDRDIEDERSRQWISHLYTPTELRLLEVLSDGEPHTKLELHACLWDELASVDSVPFHMSNLRRKLRARGETVLSTFFNRKYCYIHVKLLNA